MSVLEYALGFNLGMQPSRGLYEQVLIEHLEFMVDLDSRSYMVAQTVLASTRAKLIKGWSASWSSVGIICRGRYGDAAGPEVQL